MGKFLLTCSIMILFILLQTEKIISIRIGRSRLGGSRIRKPSLPSTHLHIHSKPSYRPNQPSDHRVISLGVPGPPKNLPENWSARFPLPDWLKNAAKQPPNHANRRQHNPTHPLYKPINPQDPEHPLFYPVNRQKTAHLPNNPINQWNLSPYIPANRSPVIPQNRASSPPSLVNRQNPAPRLPYSVIPQNPGLLSPSWVNPQNRAPHLPYSVIPQNPGYFPHQPYDHQNPHYNPKPWKPKLPKAKGSMKYVAGGPIAGGAARDVGGYFLGRGMFYLHFQFNNPNEERWWYENRNRYSDRVYYPQYMQPVPQDTFVRDCVNITVKEYIEPTGNTTEDEMEALVVKHVVKEMCIEQYRTFSSYSEGGSSRPHDDNPGDPKPKGDEVKYVVGEPVVVGDPQTYILGSPIAKMYFRFNDSKEERWWNENRHRFATHVYHPNISQPISRDVFLSECVNVTVGEYVKPTGNQTEDELEARVVTQVANEKCVEMYPRLILLTMVGSYYNNKPETATTLEIKSKFKYGEGAALANSPRGASGYNSPKNGVSDLHVSFENALFLIHPFAITLITPFLIF